MYITPIRSISLYISISDNIQINIYIFIIIYHYLSIYYIYIHVALSSPNSSVEAEVHHICFLHLRDMHLNHPGYIVRISRENCGDMIWLQQQKKEFCGSVSMLHAQPASTLYHLLATNYRKDGFDNESVSRWGMPKYDNLTARRRWEHG
jgi:hypothetical protein